MKRILVTGALGQIGSELTAYLRNIYGGGKVLATDIRNPGHGHSAESEGPFEVLDVLEPSRFAAAATRFKADTIIHLAALLSAVAESNPVLAWNINMNGLCNALEIARQLGCSLFVPSSIGCFGPSTPRENTPQDTMQRPETMYGVTKAAGEMLCDYYHKRFGTDTRGLRFPGLISHVTLPGGGTTDYAVEIFYAAVESGAYTCYLSPETRMDMMYMPDALRAVVMLMEADPAGLVHRNAFNVTAISAAPEHFEAEIRKHMPDFKVTYEVDPVRQSIADSWPDSLDDSAARTEWGYRHDYDLAAITSDMLTHLRNKLNRKL